MQWRSRRTGNPPGPVRQEPPRDLKGGQQRRQPWPQKTKLNRYYASQNGLQVSLNVKRRAGARLTFVLSFVTPDEQVAQRVQSMLTSACPRQKLSTSTHGQTWASQRSGAPFYLCYRHPMATTYLYRCPSTGQTVQGWSADELADDDVYDLVTCVACTKVHLINPKTRKVLGEEED